MAVYEHEKNYHNSKTYQAAGEAARKQLETYKSELGISDEHMSWLMYLQDLRSMPKEDRQKGNFAAEALVIFSMFILIIGAATQIRPTMILGSVMVIVTAIIYFSGILNPISTTTRKVKKQLKKYPTVPDFKTWQSEKGQP